ncbi:MAG TPA: hypothetical protein VHN99_08530, partial [Deinococcales bacterium]|nr:hypothetical protein [Deinococcales bacterium]
MAKTRTQRAIAALVGLLALCGLTAAAPAPALPVVNVGLGYLPDVQFAPFYLAEQSGLYRQAGLDVHF